MEIQPIKTEKDYKSALRTIEEIWGAEESTPEGDRLDVLMTLVEAYEASHHPIYPPDPISAIEFHMDQNQLERSDIEKYIGTRARVSEILNRRRGLSIEMIRNLHEGLGIPLESLIGKPRESKAS